MTKCKHKGRLYQFAVVYGPTTAQAISSGNAGHTVVGQCRCDECHEVVPLGHSDEAPVSVEVRAAELAVAPLVSIERWPATMHGQEPHGWMGHRRDDTPIDPQQSYWAGWLAREIHTHDGGGE